MKTINWILLVALISFLGACKASKDAINETIQTQVPNAYRVEYSTDTNSIGKISWREFFTDKTLQDLIDSAIVKNNDMKLALNNIDKAKLLVKQAKWNYVPNLNVGISAQTNLPSQSTLNGISLNTFLGKTHVEDFNLNAGLSWEIDIWGKIANQKNGAQASFLQSEEAKRALQTQLISIIAKSYYNLLTLDKQIEIAKQNVVLSDTILSILHLQHQMGQTTLLAVQQVEAQRLLAMQLIPQFEQQIGIQENALSVLCGQVPGGILHSTTLDETELAKDLSTGVPAQLLANRPDVKVAELELKKANFNVGYTHAAMFPSLVINAQGGLESLLLGDWFRIPTSLFGILGGGLTQPILQRRQLHTRWQLAKIDREAAVINFRQQMLVAVQEVSDALIKIDKLKTQQDIATQRANLLIDATGNADLLFETGLATYLEVITAQANQLNAAIDAATIKKAQLDAQIDLYRSLGGGWQ